MMFTQMFGDLLPVLCISNTDLHTTKISDCLANTLLGKPKASRSAASDTRLHVKLVLSDLPFSHRGYHQHLNNTFFF